MRGNDAPAFHTPLPQLTTVILETFEKIQDTAAWTLTPQHLEVPGLGWTEGAARA